MERELIPEIFDNYRENLKQHQVYDDETTHYIKTICLEWNRTGPGYGIQIQTTDNNTYQGLAWYICPYENKIRYYLEEYQQNKVIINHYDIPIENIKFIKYLGKSNTVRPLLNQPSCNNPCSLEVVWRH
jgi:hypothetical protein